MYLGLHTGCHVAACPHTTYVSQPGLDALTHTVHTSAVVTVALTSPRTAAMMSSNVDAIAGSSPSLSFCASTPAVQRSAAGAPQHRRPFAAAAAQVAAQLLLIEGRCRGWWVRRRPSMTQAPNWQASPRPWLSL